jgi:hypothetical protein
MEAGMALSTKLDLCLRFERIMIELDDREYPIADLMRDLMDPIWYGLSDEDRLFLDSRKEINIQVLYPITLAVPDLFKNRRKSNHRTKESIRKMVWVSTFL